MARLDLVAANPQKQIKPRAVKAPRPVVVMPSNDDYKDHFINRNGVVYAGSHVIIKAGKPRAWMTASVLKPR